MKNPLYDHDLDALPPTDPGSGHAGQAGPKPVPGASKVDGGKSACGPAKVVDRKRRSRQVAGLVALILVSLASLTGGPGKPTARRAAIVAPRPIPPVPPRPPAYRAANMPSMPARVVVPRSTPPVAVPLPIEEVPEPWPAVSFEELKSLREEYRRMPVLRLQVIMDGVRRVCASEDHRRPGWRDYPLEFAIDEMVFRVMHATRRPNLELPVRFGQPSDGEPGSREVALKVSGKESGQGVSRSILLVDGDVDMTFISDCLIVATGKVRFQHGSGNVILAGEIGTLSERGRERDGRPIRPSVLMAETSIFVHDAENLITSAPEGIRGTFLRNMASINSLIEFQHQTGFAKYASKLVDLRRSPLSGGQAGRVRGRGGMAEGAPRPTSSGGRTSGRR